MAYADLSDVRIQHRELGPDEDVAEWVDDLLGLAETRIRVDFPDLDARVADGRSPLALVVLVEAEMVAGVTKNPNSYASNSEGIGGLSESRTYNLQVASGLIEFTERQRAMVAAVPAVPAASSGGAYTIRPGTRVPRF